MCILDIYPRFPLYQETAIKVESATSTKQVLKMEVAVLKRLQGTKQFCDLLGYGRTEKVNYLVMNLLGPNLSELRKRQSHQTFSMSTTLRLGIQILNALQALHNCGFLHRDLKPSNIAIGHTSETCRTCFLLDFGLARQYITPTGEVREPRPTAGFRGTVRYASINAHLAKDLGRNDDLWSLFYMIIEIGSGELPWRKVKEKDEVGKLKAECDYGKLIKAFPSEFLLFLKHIQSLSYFDKPEYSYLTDLFRKAMQKLAIHELDPFDWEQDTSAPSVTTASVGSPPAFRSHGKVSQDAKNHETKGKSGTKTDCSDVKELSKHAKVSETKKQNSMQECLPVAANNPELSAKQNIEIRFAVAETPYISNGLRLAEADDHHYAQNKPVCHNTVNNEHCITISTVHDQSNAMHPHAAPSTSAKQNIAFHTPAQSSLYPDTRAIVPRPPQDAPPCDYVCVSARRKRFVQVRVIKT